MHSIKLCLSSFQTALKIFHYLKHFRIFSTHFSSIYLFFTKFPYCFSKVSSIRKVYGPKFIWKILHMRDFFPHIYFNIMTSDGLTEIFYMFYKVIEINGKNRKIWLKILKIQNRVFMYLKYVLVIKKENLFIFDAFLIELFWMFVKSSFHSKSFFNRNLYEKYVKWNICHWFYIFYTTDSKL